MSLSKTTRIEKGKSLIPCTQSALELVAQDIACATTFADCLTNTKLTSVRYLQSFIQSIITPLKYEVDKDLHRIA